MTTAGEVSVAVVKFQDLLWDVSQIKYIVLTDLEYAINILKN